jgi:hypothetical protein
MQDDLINMMSRHLQLSPQVHNGSMPPTPQVSPHSAPITYITQHYHHSAHQASTTESQVSTVLEAAGINAAALLPTQITLFRNAEAEQKDRLIELWRIAPPTPGNQMLPGDMNNWPQTTMEKEEEAARYRYENERDKLKNLTNLPGFEARMQAEPYIVDGYGELPNASNADVPSTYRSAEQQQRLKDPVYNNTSREWWSLDDQPMEHQYGLLQAMMYGNPIDHWRLGGHVTRREDEDEEML